jgi:ABC-type multidrug transport system ATPase subunit
MWFRKRKERIKELTEFTGEFSIISNDVKYSVDFENIIKGVSLTVKKGEILTLLGHSGSGKTTLLKLLYGLILPDEGEVFINGVSTDISDNEELAETTKKMGFFFQGGSLISNIDVFENITLMNAYHGLKEEKEIEKKTDVLLEEFGVEKRKNTRPGQLSLNEKKAITFIRLLVNDFDTLFFDDPFASVDVYTVRKMKTELRRLKRLKKTILLTTLDTEFAYKFSDKIAVLSEGNLLFFGTSGELLGTDDKNVKNIISELTDLVVETRDEHEA